MPPGFLIFGTSCDHVVRGALDPVDPESFDVPEVHVSAHEIRLDQSGWAGMRQ